MGHGFPFWSFLSSNVRPFVSMTFFSSVFLSVRHYSDVLKIFLTIRLLEYYFYDAPRPSEFPVSLIFTINICFKKPDLSIVTHYEIVCSSTFFMLIANRRTLIKSESFVTQTLLRLDIFILRFFDSR